MSDPVGLDDLRDQVYYEGDNDAEFASPEQQHGGGAAAAFHQRPVSAASSGSSNSNNPVAAAASGGGGGGDINVLVLDDGSGASLSSSHPPPSGGGGLPPRPARVGSTASTNSSKPPKAPTSRHHHHHQPQHNYTNQNYDPSWQHHQNHHHYQQQQQQQQPLNNEAQLIQNLGEELRQIYHELGLLRPDCPTAEMDRRRQWLQHVSQLVSFFQSSSPVMEPQEWQKNQGRAQLLELELARARRRRTLTLDVCRSVEDREHALRAMHEVVIKADQALYSSTAAHKTLSKRSAPQVAREAEAAAAEVKACTINVLHKLVEWAKAVGSKVVYRAQQQQQQNQSLLFGTEPSDSESGGSEDDEQEEDRNASHNGGSKNNSPTKRVTDSLESRLSSGPPPRVDSTAPSSPADLAAASHHQHHHDSASEKSRAEKRQQALELLCETFSFRNVPYLEKIRRDSAFVYQTASLQCLLSQEVLLAFKNFASVQQAGRGKDGQEEHEQHEEGEDQAEISAGQHQPPSMLDTTVSPAVSRITATTPAPSSSSTSAVRGGRSTSNGNNNSKSNKSKTRTSSNDGRSKKLRQATRNRLPNELPLSNSPKASEVGAGGETLMRLFSSAVVPSGTLIHAPTHNHIHHHQKKKSKTLLSTKQKPGACCGFLDEWEYPESRPDSNSPDRSYEQQQQQQQHRASSSSMFEQQLAHERMMSGSAASAASASAADGQARPGTRRGSSAQSSSRNNNHEQDHRHKNFFSHHHQQQQQRKGGEEEEEEQQRPSARYRDAVTTEAEAYESRRGQLLRREVRQQQREARARSNMTKKIRESVRAAAEAKPLSPIPHSSLPHPAAHGSFGQQTVCVGGLAVVIPATSPPPAHAAAAGRTPPQQQQQKRDHEDDFFWKTQKRQLRNGNDDDDDDGDAFDNVVRTSGDGRPWSADDVLHGNDVGSQVQHRLLTPPPHAQRMRFSSPGSGGGGGGSPSRNSGSNASGSGIGADGAGSSSQQHPARISSATSSTLLINGSSARGGESLSPAEEAIFRGGRGGGGGGGGGKLSVFESVQTSPPAAGTSGRNGDETDSSFMSPVANNNNNNNNSSSNARKGVRVDKDGLEYVGRSSDAPSAVREKALKQTALCALSLMEEMQESRKNSKNNNNTSSSTSTAAGGGAGNNVTTTSIVFDFSNQQAGGGGGGGGGADGTTPLQHSSASAAGNNAKNNSSRASSGGNRSSTNSTTRKNNTNTSGFNTSQHHSSPPPTKMHQIVAAEERERREYQRAKHNEAMMRMKHPAFRRNAYSSRHARNAKGPAEYWSSVIVFFVLIKMLARRALGRARRRLAARKICVWYRRVSRKRSVVQLLSDEAWDALKRIRSKHVAWTNSLHLRSAFDHAFAIAHMRAFYIQKAFYRYVLRNKMYQTVLRVVAGLRIQRFIRNQFQIVYKTRVSIRRKYSARKIQRFFRIFRKWSNPLLRMPATRGENETQQTYKMRVMRAVDEHRKSKMACIPRYDRKADKMNYIPFVTDDPDSPDSFISQFKLKFEFSTGITERLRCMRVHLDGRIGRELSIRVRLIQRFMTGAQALQRYRQVAWHYQVHRFYVGRVLRRRLRPTAAIQRFVWAFNSARLVATLQMVRGATAVLHRVGKFLPAARRAMTERARTAADVREMMEKFAVATEQEEAARKVQRWARIEMHRRAALRAVTAARERHAILSRSRQKVDPSEQERQYAARKLQTYWRMYILARMWRVAQRAWRFIRTEWEDIFEYEPAVMRIQDQYRFSLGRHREMAAHKQRRAEHEASKIMSGWAPSRETDALLPDNEEDPQEAERRRKAEEEERRQLALMRRKRLERLRREEQQHKQEQQQLLQQQQQEKERATAAAASSDDDGSRTGGGGGGGGAGGSHFSSSARTPVKEYESVERFRRSKDPLKSPLRISNQNHSVHGSSEEASLASEDEL